MCENLLYEEIYAKTQNCGRAQFVKLLQKSQIKITQLQKENKYLKKQVEIKHNGFMSSVEETCEYATILDKFKKWLEEEMDKEEDCWYGSTLIFADDKRQVLIEIYDKLQEMKGEIYNNGIL